MAKGKASSNDRNLLEFFQKFWPYVCLDYHAMIFQRFEGGGMLHEGISKKLISLIPKKGDKANLNYWRPITLLTVVYKIFAKTLQLRLQPILKDIISPEQTIFLPLRFILDNIILTLEASH
jgi:hypothetical protein